MSPGGVRPDETVRHLRLRGGALDGATWSGVIDVGKRVCCGPGLWSKECVYVVTGDTTIGPDGQVESVAVPPAAFTSALAAMRPGILTHGSRPAGGSRPASTDLATAQLIPQG